MSFQGHSERLAETLRLSDAIARQTSLYMTRWGHSIGHRKQAELDYVAVRSILSYLADKLIYLKDKSIRRLVNNSQRPLLEIRLTERTVTLQAIPILPGSDRCSVPEASRNADLYLLVEVDWDRRTATLIGFSEQVRADFSRSNFQHSKQGLFDALKRLFNSEDAAPSSEDAAPSSESVASPISTVWQRWLSFVGKTWQARRQAISALQFESTKPKFHSWVLEPQLTPSAIVGRLGGLDPWGDDLQFDGFDGDGLPEVPQFSDDTSHDASTAESVSVDSPASIEVVPTIASSLDPVDIADDEIDWHSAADLAEEADIAEGEEPEPLLDSVVPDSSESIAALNSSNAIPISSGVFIVDSSGQVTFEFISDGGSFAGEVAIFSLEGMDPTSIGTNQFSYEAASRALGLSASGTGHVVISDITEGAAIGTQFNQGEFLGLQRFDMTPGIRFGIMLVPNGSIQQLYDSYYTVDDNYDAVDVIFSMGVNQEYGNLVAVPNQEQVFGFEDLGDVYTGDCDDIIFRMTGASGYVPQHDDYSNEVLDSLQDYIDATPISPPTTPNTPPTLPEPAPPTSVDPSSPASPPDVPSNPPKPGAPVAPGTPDTGIEDATAPPTSVESPPVVSLESPTEVSRLSEAHLAPTLAIDPAAAPPPLSNPTLPESTDSLVADTVPRATLATIDAGATDSLSLTSSNLLDLMQAPEADSTDVTPSSLPWESIAKALPDIDLLTLPADSLLPSLTETVQFIVVLEVFSRLLASNSSLSYRQLRNLLGWTETGIKATGTRLRGDED